MKCYICKIELDQANMCDKADGDFYCDLCFVATGCTDETHGEECYTAVTETDEERKV